jgi:hypothetical protein
MKICAAYVTGDGFIITKAKNIYYRMTQSFLEIGFYRKYTLIIVRTE